MSKSHLNDGTTIVSFRVPIVYKSMLNEYIKSSNMTNKQWLISHIELDTNNLAKRKEYMKTISDFKESMFFLKAYTTLDKDKKRARIVLKNLDALDKQLSELMINNT